LPAPTSPRISGALSRGGDKLVRLEHCGARTYRVLGAQFLLDSVAQLAVFGVELFVLLHVQKEHGDGVGDYVGDCLQEFEVALELVFRRVFAVYAQRSDDAVFRDNRNAQKGGLHVHMAAARAVEKVGTLRNVLHYARNSARGDVTRHALTDAVDPPAPLLIAKPVRGADYEHVAVLERDSPAGEVHLRVENVEHLF